MIAIESKGWNRNSARLFLKTFSEIFFLLYLKVVQLVEYLYQADSQNSQENAPYWGLCIKSLHIFSNSVHMWPNKVEPNSRALIWAWIFVEFAIGCEFLQSFSIFWHQRQVFASVLTFPSSISWIFLRLLTINNSKSIYRWKNHIKHLTHLTFSNSK